MNRHESIEILRVKKSTQSGEVVEVPPSEIKNKTVYPSIKLDVTYTSDYKTVCVGTVCNFERFNDIYNALKTITTACAKINKLENKSDNVYNKAVFEIFENETDVKNIIKYKEVLSVLETATDKCKSVASVLESITVKHS